MNKQLKTIALGMVFLGAILCYLLVNRTNALQGDNPGSWDICKMLFSVTCDGVLLHSLSFQLGYPLSVLGIIYFAVLGFLLIADKPATRNIAIAVASIGAGISLLLSALLLFTILVCPLCILIHITNLLLLVLMIATQKGSEMKSTKPSRKLAMAAVVLLLIAVGVLGELWVVGNSAGLNNLRTFESTYAEFEGAPPEEVLMGSFSNEKPAPVEIAVFSSFQCPSCKQMKKTLESLQQQYGDQVEVLFFNFPLSSKCNPVLSGDMQPRSCEAALAAIAASYQDNFWPYHDKIFESQLQLSDEDLTQYARELNLDMDKWESDRNSEQAKKDLEAQINIGNSVTIPGTPTLYINGKRCPQNDATFLHYAIYNALNQD